jgi:hypothetical protein
MFIARVVVASAALTFTVGCGGSDHDVRPDGPSSDGTGCPLPAYPDESCTGVPAGVTLTTMVGDLEIDTPDTVIDGMDIQGCVLIKAPGVVIRNSKITCGNALAVASYRNYYTGTGVLLEDVEITCGDTVGTAVGDYNVTVRRANIHGCENGFDVDGEISVVDSYIHDLYINDAIDTHTDGLQITPVGQNVVIKHNTIYMNNGNAAIITPRVSAGVVDNVLIEANLMAGGGYTLYCEQDGPATNYRVIDNHFSTKFYDTIGDFGPWTDCFDETLSGNVVHETGDPVAPE